MRLPRVRISVRWTVALVALLAVPLTVIAWAPSFGRGSLERGLAQLDTGRLASDAERLWANYRGTGRGITTVPSEEWGPAIRALRPERVYVRPEGVYVATRSFFVEESGLFILPASSTFVPQSGTDPGYHKLVGSFYWYHIKG